jgi:tetratricopeptide (TPR) repeat protein
MGGQNTSTLRRVNALITEGKLDEATAFLEQKMISENADDITLQERYFNLLKIKKQTPQLLEYGVSLLELLVQKNQRKKACMVFEECISHGNNFVPQAEILFTLGTWFNEFGNSKIAIKAYNLFTKVYSNNELVPKAYFNKAQILHSNYSDTATAKRILADIIQKYPKNEITPHVKHYLQILE